MLLGLVKSLPIRSYIEVSLKVSPTSVIRTNYKVWSATRISRSLLQSKPR